MIKRIHGKHGTLELHYGPLATSDGPTRLDLRDELRAQKYAREFFSTPTGAARTRSFMYDWVPGLARMTDAQAIEYLARALRSGRVQVTSGRTLARAIVSLSEDEAESSEGESEEEERTVKTWIEIELVGEDDAPIPGARFELVLPDGTVREGRLNKEGRAYFGGLDPGQCEIRWPDLDEGAVQDASAEQVAPTRRASQGGRPGGSANAGAASSGSEKTWVEIELLGEDDAPLAGAPYWIKLPDGTVQEGFLDGQGRAYFSNLDPGQCEIRWPGLDEGAIEDPSGEAPNPRADATGSRAIAAALGRT